MDLRQADLGLLIALDALIAERSVTRAADRLGLSQPAMSAQLARLRDLFEDPLLVSFGKRMVPTLRATEIQEPLHRLLDELTALVRERQTFDPSKSDRTFRVMATDYMHRIVSLPTMKVLAEAAPKVRLAMVLHDARRAWQALEEDEIELLIASDRLTPKHAKARVLMEEGFVFVQRKGHPRGRKALDVGRFCMLDHILVSPEGGGFSGATDETLAGFGRKRRVVASLPSFLLAAPLVAGTDLVAVLPERLARLMDDAFDIFPLPFKSIRFNVVMSWHARRERDPGHQWLREKIAARFSTDRGKPQPGERGSVGG
jgi:DNA-binding transcriptional LysR family regulator